MLNHATLATVAESREFELEIGFDLETPEGEARERVVDRWTAAVARAGARPAGNAVDIMLNRSPGLERIGQFSVVVSGRVVDDD